MFTSYTRDGQYWTSISGLRAKENWLRGQWLWVQGGLSATMEVTRYKSKAAKGGKMVQE